MEASYPRNPYRETASSAGHDNDDIEIASTAGCLTPITSTSERSGNVDVWLLNDELESLDNRW